MKAADFTVVKDAQRAAREQLLSFNRMMASKKANAPTKGASTASAPRNSGETKQK